MCREQRETKEKSFINIAPIGWRLVHSQVGCIQSAGAKARFKKNKTLRHLLSSSWLNLQFSPRQTPTKDDTLAFVQAFRLHCFQAASESSPAPFLVSATGGLVLSDGWTRSPFMHLCRFSLAGSLKSDFAPSCAGTTHVPARRRGAGVPPYHVCRAIRVTNRPHVGEKSHARARAPVCPSSAHQKGLFAMCFVCSVRE